MTIAEVLLDDFDAETISTRRVLERIPEGKESWKPHEKSMSLSQLALHVATIPGFGLTILKEPPMDLATAKFPKYTFEGVAKLIEVSAGLAGEVRTALASMSDEELQSEWTLSFGGQVVARGTRQLLYRTMFFNHLIHHRGQLTVYLRLLDIAVPGIYGPSADEPFTR